MNFHQLLLLGIIILCLGFLGLWIKQGVTTQPIVVNTSSSSQTIKVVPTAPVQATPPIDTWSNQTIDTYKPQPQSLPKEPTLLQKAHTFAYENGITSLATIDWFKPQEPLSRESAARMFTQFGRVVHGESYFRFLNTSWSCEFKDKADITRGFYRDVVEACYMGYMGWTEGVFAPRSWLNHAQAATIIARITWIPVSTGSQLPITRWWLIEMMLDQYLLQKTTQ